MNSSVTRFIELVLSPRAKDGADATTVQRQALERMRDLRPGMLIDHIEETVGEASSPARTRALLTRLRSHTEARTFDELRIYEIGRLIRPEDPGWHQAIIGLVHQARAVLVDSTGIVADPANPEGIRATPPTPGLGGGVEAPRAGGSPHSPEDWSAAPAPRETGPAAAPRATAPPLAGGASRGHWEPRRPAGGAVTAGFTVLCESRVFCEVCGQPLAIQSLGHERKRYYTCASLHLHPPSDCQPEIAFPVEPVDEVVWDRFTSALDPLEPALAALRKALSRDLASGEDQRALHQGRLERLQRDELEVLGLRSEDRISESAARRRLEEISRERRALEEQLRDGHSAARPLDVLVTAIEEVLPQGRSAQSVPPPERRRLLLAAIPDSAEYGILLLATGEVQVRSLLDDHDLRPTMRHKAQAIGAAVQGIRERAGDLSPQRSLSALSRLLRAIKERLTPAAPSLAPQRPAEHPPAAPGVLTFSRTVGISRARIAMYGIALVAAILVAIVLRPTPLDSAPSENLVDQIGMGEQLVEIYRVPGGWLGRTSTAWVGATDVSLALAACNTLAQRLAPGQRETITLLRPEGVPLVECGPPSE